MQNLKQKAVVQCEFILQKEFKSFQLLISATYSQNYSRGFIDIKIKFLRLPFIRKKLFQKQQVTVSFCFDARLNEGAHFFLLGKNKIFFPRENKGTTKFHLCQLRSNEFVYTQLRGIK